MLVCFSDMAAQWSDALEGRVGYSILLVSGHSKQGLWCAWKFIWCWLVLWFLELMTNFLMLLFVYHSVIIFEKKNNTQDQIWIASVFSFNWLITRKRYKQAANVAYNIPLMWGEGCQKWFSLLLIFSCRNCLTWRDVQSILVYSAVKFDVEGAEWVENGAGFHHSDQHGFGLMDAYRMTSVAGIWPLLPKLLKVHVAKGFHVPVSIPSDGFPARVDIIGKSFIISLW